MFLIKAKRGFKLSISKEFYQRILDDRMWGKKEKKKNLKNTLESMCIPCFQQKIILKKFQFH